MATDNGDWCLSGPANPECEVVAEGPMMESPPEPEPRFVDYGFYWVRDVDGWTVARFVDSRLGPHWLRVGDSLSLSQDAIAEIGPFIGLAPPAAEGGRT